MLQRYETLYITVPAITQDESTKVENQLTKAIKDAKGAVISFEKWGKYNLAYPIRKNDYGVYFLLRFEIDDERKSDVLKELKSIFGVRLHDLIMRNMVIRLNPEGSLEYKRPESLEEAPQEIDNIMKESKQLLRPMTAEPSSETAVIEADKE